MPNARRQISWQLTGVVNWIIFEPWGGGEGVLLGIIGGGVPPCSPNFRPKNFFFHSRFE